MELQRVCAYEVRRDHDRDMVVNGCFHILCCYKGIENVFSLLFLSGLIPLAVWQCAGLFCPLCWQA